MEHTSRPASISLVLAAVALLGCASPRSFDPSENGQSYGDTSYSSYQACLDSLVPLGQGAGCQSNPGGSGSGGRIGGASGSGGYNPSGYGPSGYGKVSATSPQDAYFEDFKTWPKEARDQQEQIWLELAARAGK